MRCQNDTDSITSGSSKGYNHTQKFLVKLYTLMLNIQDFPLSRSKDHDALNSILPEASPKPDKQKTSYDDSLSEFIQA